MRALRDALAPIVADKSGSVLGSSPHGPLPAQGEAPLLSANGSQGLLGTPSRPVDVAFLGGYTTRPRTAAIKASLEKLRGQSAGLLVFVAHGDRVASAREALAGIGFQYDSMVAIDPYERAAIIGATVEHNYGLGPRDSRISMGVFAMVCALWAGAADVTAYRVSLSSGHAFNTTGAPRAHRDGDRGCLNELTQAGLVQMQPSSPESDK